MLPYQADENWSKEKMATMCSKLKKWECKTFFIRNLPCKHLHLEEIKFENLTALMLHMVPISSIESLLRTWMPRLSLFNLSNSASM